MQWGSQLLLRRRGEEILLFFLYVYMQYHSDERKYGPRLVQIWKLCGRLYHCTVDVGSEFCEAMHVLLAHMATAGGWGLLWWGGRIQRVRCRKRNWKNNGWKLPKFGERKILHMWSRVNLKQDKCKEIPDIMPRHHKQIAENLRKKKSRKMMH